MRHIEKSEHVECVVSIVAFYKAPATLGCIAAVMTAAMQL